MNPEAIGPFEIPLKWGRREKNGNAVCGTEIAYLNVPSEAKWPPIAFVEKIKMTTIMRRNIQKVVLLATAVSGFAFVDQVYAQGPAIAQPVSNWSYTGHSSTLVEGALRGQSAVISSIGQTVYFDSLAAVNYAEAYKRAIENSVAVTKSYYERRAIRDEYMQKYAPRAFVGEARKKFIEYYSPKRLSAQEFDSQHGKLTWPHILRQEQFSPVKDRIDQVFQTRDSSNTGDGSTTHREVYQLCNALTGLLRENIGNMTSDQYINALEFIRSVELEAKTAMPGEFKALPVTVEEEKPIDPVPAIKKDSDTSSVRAKAVRAKI